MCVREGIEFLVQEIIKQATLDNGPLSHFERRRLSFTASGETRQDPIELISAYDAEDKTDQ